MRCSLRVSEPNHSPQRRFVETVVRMTSRSPMSCEANLAVPPPSLAEALKITVFPQFSTIVCASPP